MIIDPLLIPMPLALALGLLCGLIREHRKGRIRYLLTVIFGGFVAATALLISLAANVPAEIDVGVAAISIAIVTILCALPFALGMFIGDALGLALEQREA